MRSVNGSITKREIVARDVAAERQRYLGDHGGGCFAGLRFRSMLPTSGIGVTEPVTSNLCPTIVGDCVERFDTAIATGKPRAFAGIGATSLL